MTPEGVQELVDFAFEELGSVEVLVNNAGIQYVSKIEDFPLEKYQQIIALNMNAAFYASRAVFKHMKTKSLVELSTSRQSMASAPRNLSRHMSPQNTESLALRKFWRWKEQNLM